MKEVADFLQENRNGFLATVEAGRPKVRPFQFMFETDGKFVFCTSNKKPVFAQLKKTPYVEFSAMTPAFAWVRLSGEVQFSTDLAMKSRIIAENALVRSIYKTAENPDFEIFYLEHGQAILADFSGQPARTFTF